MHILPEGSEPFLADKLKEFLAGFAPGSRRQSETKKCATAMKYEWYQAAVTHLCSYVRDAIYERDATLEAVKKYNAVVDKQYDDFFKQRETAADREEATMEKYSKAITMIEDYQLKSISLMSRQEHLKVEAENANMLDELKKLHQKCWDFDACVSKECQRLKINQKSGRKRKPENKPHFNPFTEPPVAACATTISCPSPTMKITVKRSRHNSPTAQTPNQKARVASGTPQIAPVVLAAAPT